MTTSSTDTTLTQWKERERHPVPALAPEDGKRPEGAFAAQERGMARRRVPKGRDTAAGGDAHGKGGVCHSAAGRPYREGSLEGSPFSRMYAVRAATVARALRASSLLAIFIPNSFSRRTTSSSASIESRDRPPPTRGSLSGMSAGATS